MYLWGRRKKNYVPQRFLKTKECPLFNLPLDIAGFIEKGDYVGAREYIMLVAKQVDEAICKEVANGKEPPKNYRKNKWLERMWINDIFEKAERQRVAERKIISFPTLGRRDLYGKLVQPA